MAADSRGRILFIDPYGGVSGDMLLGALAGIGVPIEVMAEAVEQVIPGEVRLRVGDVVRAGLAATRCEVVSLRTAPPRGLAAMEEAVSAARLPPAVRDGALRVLSALGSAEARAHGAKAPAHLHELGGQDTLADVVGVLAGFAALAPSEVACGPINVGSGLVQTAHGALPVPAPATAALLSGLPAFCAGPALERATPTGVALLREVATVFGPMPAMTVRGASAGAGAADTPGLANCLRILAGEEAAAKAAASEPSSVLIECGVDDVSPEYLAPVPEALTAAGAREVHMIPASTKKGRVGMLVRVLAPAEKEREIVDSLLNLTGSSGLRLWPVRRAVLPRESVTVRVDGQPVRVKRWRSPDGRWRAKPEFEDVSAAARALGLGAPEVRERAMAVYLGEREDGQEED